MMVRAYYGQRPDAIVRAMGDLGEALIARGIDVKVLALRYGSVNPQIQAAYPHLDEIPLEPHFVPGSDSAKRALEQIWFMLAATIWLIRNRSTFDIVITIDTPTGIGLVGRLLRRVSRGRVLHIHWVMDLFYSQLALLQPERKRFWHVGLRRGIELAALRGQSPLVVLGKCMSTYLYQQKVTAPIRVIPIWAPETLVEEGAEVSPRRELFTVFYGGHAAARNPLGVILEAAQILRNEPVLFDIVGSGSEIDLIKAAVKNENPSNVIVSNTLKGADYSVRSRSADVHIVSLDSRVTGTCVPSKTYAAMASGKAVFYLGGGDGQAAMDVLKAGAGYVLPHSGYALADALQATLIDATESVRLGANGRQFVLSERTERHAAQRWFDFLSETKRR